MAVSAALGLGGAGLCSSDFLPQLQEPLLLLGKERFSGVDIRVRVKGGGHVAQIYGKPLRGQHVHAVSPADLGGWTGGVQT